MSELSGSEQKKEDWMNSKWRPMMGWMYMLICTMDMVVFPVLWSLLQATTHTAITQWNPLTLQGAGLFHIAMGAVLGIAAFGRTQEKLQGANNGGLQAPATGSPSGFTAPSAPSTGSFGAPSSGFGSAPLGGNTASSFGGSGFGSTPAPSSSFGGSSGFGASTAPAVTASGKKIVPDADQPAI
jgi:Holin of 3TMs, for gene-transfer release